MNEREAFLLADQIIRRWPAQIQANVDVPANRTDDQGYTVRIQIPRENRILRLGHPGQLPGLLDVCATLLDNPAQIMKGTMMMMIAQRQEEPGEAQQPKPELELFNEEEAATYLGIRPGTIRTYALNGTLQQHESGGFLLEELRRYKEQRRPKARPTSAPESFVSVPSAVPAQLASDEGSVATPQQDIFPSEEERIIQAVVAHAFAIPGMTGLGRLSEAPRSWKVDLMTERGPESYRVTRTIDGAIQHERW